MRLALVELVVQPGVDAAERLVVVPAERQEVVEGEQPQRPHQRVDDALLRRTFADDQDVDGDHGVRQNYERQCDQADAQLDRKQDNAADTLIDRHARLPHITAPHGDSLLRLRHVMSPAQLARVS